MTFALGMVAGIAIAIVAFVAYMAPKHWDWYMQNVTLKESLRKAIERGDHYKHMTKPTEWGPVDQHEARIVPSKIVPWDGTIGFDPDPDVHFRFDDILDGGK